MSNTENKTANFELEKLAKTDEYALSQFNGNMDIIDQEMHKPPLTVNDIEPDPETRNIPIQRVPFADQIYSDEAQFNTGTYIERTSGGEASIKSGSAGLSVIKGNLVRIGAVEESINMVVDGSGISAELDRDTFVEAVSASGTITLTYTTGWSADPATYGITVSGTPENGDSIIVVYVKQNLGTLEAPSPTSFVSTGWNLYNHSIGGAQVIKYSDEYGFMISGTYTSLKFGASMSTPAEERIVITPVNGYFTIPNDGFLFVAGGNDSDTAIWMCWSDWTEEANGGTFEAYSQSTIDLAGVMVAFPNGLLKVESDADEINFNTQRAISRISRIANTASNMETVIGYDVPYVYDGSYIYFVKPEPDVYEISVDGAYEVNDHGIERFVGTTVPVTATSLYGEDLVGKLRRDVLTISQQELTSAQKSQVQHNIGVTDALSALFVVEMRTLFDNKTIPANSFLSESYSFAEKEGYTALGVVGIYIYNASSGGVGSSNISYNALFVTADAKNVFMQWRNNGSSQAKLACRAYIIFKKNLT